MSHLAGEGELLLQHLLSLDRRMHKGLLAWGMGALGLSLGLGLGLGLGQSHRSLVILNGWLLVLGQDILDNCSRLSCDLSRDIEATGFAVATGLAPICFTMHFIHGLTCQRRHALRSGGFDEQIDLGRGPLWSKALPLLLHVIPGPHDISDVPVSVRGLHARLRDIHRST